MAGGGACIDTNCVAVGIGRHIAHVGDLDITAAGPGADTHGVIGEGIGIYLARVDDVRGTVVGGDVDAVGVIPVDPDVTRIRGGHVPIRADDDAVAVIDVDKAGVGDVRTSVREDIDAVAVCDLDAAGIENGRVPVGVDLDTVADVDVDPALVAHFGVAAGADVDAIRVVGVNVRVLQYVHHLRAIATHEHAIVTVRGRDGGGVGAVADDDCQVVDVVVDGVAVVGVIADDGVARVRDRDVAGKGRTCGSQRQGREGQRAPDCLGHRCNAHSVAPNLPLAGADNLPPGVHRFPRFNCCSAPPSLPAARTGQKAWLQCPAEPRRNMNQATTKCPVIVGSAPGCQPGKRD